MPSTIQQFNPVNVPFVLAKIDPPLVASVGDQYGGDIGEVRMNHDQGLETKNFK